MKEITVCGNGPSVRTMHVERMPRPLWACNAFYRDHEVDVLVAVDPAMQHEVYRSRRGNHHPTFFRSWSELPAAVYESIVTDDTVENYRGDCERFVAQGTNGGKSYITWVNDFDSKYINTIPEEFDTWGSGTTAVRMACEIEAPNVVHLFGMDMEGQSVYSGTKNVPVYDHDEPFAEWEQQHLQNFQDFPTIDFIYYGKRVPESWRDLPNVFEGWDGAFSRRGFARKIS